MSEAEPEVAAEPEVEPESEHEPTEKINTEFIIIKKQDDENTSYYIVKDLDNINDILLLNNSIFQDINSNKLNFVTPNDTNIQKINNKIKNLNDANADETLGGSLDETFNIQTDQFLQSLFKKITK